MSRTMRFEGGSRAWLVAFLSAMASVAPVSRAVAGHTNNATALTITSARVDTTNLVLVISGENFGTNPTVMLGGSALFVVGVSATQIIADLPTVVAPSNYLLSIFDGASPNQIDHFDVAIGTGGAPGPP